MGPLLRYTTHVLMCPADFLSSLKTHTREESPAAWISDAQEPSFFSSFFIHLFTDSWWWTMEQCRSCCSSTRSRPLPRACECRTVSRRPLPFRLRKTSSRLTTRRRTRPCTRRRGAYPRRSSLPSRGARSGEWLSSPHELLERAWDRRRSGGCSRHKHQRFLFSVHAYRTSSTAACCCCLSTE